MPDKKPFTFRSLDEKEAPSMDLTIQKVYAYKPESRYKFEGSSTAVRSYINQYMEHGQSGFSANGSGAIVKSFPLQEKMERVIFAQANASNPAVTAHVTDVTQTSITVECRAVTATTTFSAVVTASFTVYYQVIGSV